MRRGISLVSAVIGLAIAAAWTGSGQAEDASMSWSFRSNHEFSVQLQFYAQDRDVSWPVYVLDDYDVQTYRLNCWTSEKICYGAWVDGDSGTYWGVGMDDQEGCSDCCVTCRNGDAGTVTLGLY